MAEGPLHFRLEEFDNLRSGHPLKGTPFPTPLDHVPHPFRNLWMRRPRWSVVLEDREDNCSPDLSGKWWLPGEDLAMDEYPEIERRGGPAYLPGEHAEGKHVGLLGRACVNEPKSVRFDKFGGSATEEPPGFNIGPVGRERERESGPQTTQTSHPILIDEDVSLEKSEHPTLEYEGADAPF